MNWLKNLRTLSATVDVFVISKGDENQDNYQVKWKVLESLIGRRPIGVLKYLPDKSFVGFSIRTP